MAKYVVAMAAATAVQALGCAHGAAVGETQRLRDEMARFAADRDRLERRMTVVELTLADRDTRGVNQSAVSASPKATQEEAAPELRVVRALPETDLARDSVQAKIEEPALDAKETHAYQAAMKLFRAQRYDLASNAFAGFVVKWPDSAGVENAMYWRAECAFAKNDYAHSIEQLEGMMARFEQGTRVADAMLRLGQAHAKLGNKEKSKSYFERLMREFPHSEAARHLSNQETN